MKMHGGTNLIKFGGADLYSSTLITGIGKKLAKAMTTGKTVTIGEFKYNQTDVATAEGTISGDELNGFTITTPEYVITVSSDYVSASVNSGGGGSAYVLPAATAVTLGGVKVGSGLSVTEDGELSATGGSAYVLPAATAGSLGGIMVGSGLSVTAEGVLSATGGGGGGDDTFVVPSSTVWTVDGEDSSKFTATIAGIDAAISAGKQIYFDRMTINYGGYGQYYPFSFVAPIHKQMTGGSFVIIHCISVSTGVITVDYLYGSTNGSDGVYVFYNTIQFDEHSNL